MDDRFDAFVLADTLRTDRARLRSLAPNSPATVALHGLCRARKDLVAHRVRVANQLREHLNRVFPGAVGHGLCRVIHLGPLPALMLVARGGIEPPTFRFSGGRSYRLSYLAGRHGVPRRVGDPDGT